jgi:hypothetical protein
VVEIVDDECNEAPLPEALLADNVVDSFSGHTGVIKFITSSHLFVTLLQISFLQPFKLIGNRFGTEEEQKKGDTSRKVPSNAGAGKGRKPATVKATPKAVTRGAVAARNKVTAAAVASDGHCNDAKADMETEMVAEDNTTSAIASPKKKVRRAGGVSSDRL